MPRISPGDARNGALPSPRGKQKADHGRLRERKDSPMFLLRHTASLLLSAATLYCCADDPQWEANLIQNGNFAEGAGTRAASWNPGFFDGAKGSVEWKKDAGPDGAPVLHFAFTPPAKGLIQAENTLFPLPVRIPKREDSKTKQYNGRKTGHHRDLPAASRPGRT